MNVKHLYRTPISLCILISVFVNGIYAFACTPPFVSSYSSYDTHSVQINWSDINPDVIGYEIELGEKGFEQTFMPTSPLLTEPFYIAESLTPATTYQLYIRTICASDTSDWNGPYLFNTNMTNPSSCGTNLSIRDNNCPNTEPFRIQVDDQENKVLGQDVYLSSIDLIIEHNWPADLSLILESPSGKRLSLSEFIGANTSDFGDVLSADCSSVASFSNEACVQIEDHTPPYVGSFLPTGDFIDLYDGSSPNGIWQLIICDRALGDVGTIKYCHLDFQPIECNSPQNIRISDVDDTSVMVNWEFISGCITTVLEYGDKTTIVDCTDNSFRLTDLDPCTEYELVLRSDCSGGFISPNSCPFIFKTACKAISETEDFDDQGLCDAGCATSCSIDGLWQNVDTDDQDWIVNTGPSRTSFTGPEADIYGFGNYVYIENDPTYCGVGNEAILLSSCVDINAPQAECGLSFYYHMSGDDTNRLTLEASADNGMIWNKLFVKTGDQNDEWRRVEIDLSFYDGMTVIFRFKALSGSGVKADIAIDQIDFYGSVRTDLFTYYKDDDGDGYGTDAEILNICENIIPEGFSDNNTDCDDTNENIFPGAEEITCNQIDDNCNGNGDELDPVDPLTATVLEVISASCNGINNGIIRLSVSGGQPPYNIVWSEPGSTTEFINMLATGYYFAEISDQAGCKIVTEDIFVDANEVFSIDILAINNAGCKGVNNGSIEIDHPLNNEPYTYEWSHGDDAKNPGNLPPGVYAVSVTDGNGCTTIMKNILIGVENTINVGVQFRQNIRCNGLSDGQILLNTSGGTAPYEYIWSSGHDTALADQLPAGNYTCTVTDGTGCQQEISVSLTEPDPLKALLINAENLLCFEDMSGNIETTVTGGTAPYTYNWNNQYYTDDIFNLPAGTYTLTVTDMRGCIDVMDTIFLTQPEALNSQTDSIRDVSCQLSEDGYISVLVNGGQNDYTYYWEKDPSEEPFLENLSKGFYAVRIVDGHECKLSIPAIEVGVTGIPLMVNTEVLTVNKCVEDKMASIRVEVMDATTPVNYNWSNGNQYDSNKSIDTLTNLPSGSYAVTITDSEGCIGISDTSNIDEVAPFFYELVEVVNNKCHDDESGSISIEIEGGQEPYTVNWSNEESGLIIENLPKGEYVTTITDDNDCEIISQAIFVDAPDPLKAVFEITHALIGQSNGSINIFVQGGTMPHSWVWLDDIAPDNTKKVENLPTGTYFVQITDTNNCVLDTFAFVDMVSNVENPDNDNTKIKIYPQPGKENITIDWSEHPVNWQELTIYNISGETVLQRSIEQINKFNLRSETVFLKPGLYIVKLNDGRQSIFKKLIMQ